MTTNFLHATQSQIPSALLPEQHNAIGKYALLQLRVKSSTIVTGPALIYLQMSCKNLQVPAQIHMISGSYMDTFPGDFSSGLGQIIRQHYEYFR